MTCFIETKTKATVFGIEVVMVETLVTATTH